VPVHKDSGFRLLSFFFGGCLGFCIAQLFLRLLSLFLYKREKLIFFIFKGYLKPSPFINHVPEESRGSSLTAGEVGFFENCCSMRFWQEMLCNKVINFSSLRYIYAKLTFPVQPLIG
jgi:hypothetical protein